MAPSAPSANWLPGCLDGHPIQRATYQRLIVRVAEYMVRIILRENADPDINEALRGGYAEWFAAHNSSRNTRDQRLSRGRVDVCALLQTIVERGDLIA